MKKIQLSSESRKKASKVRVVEECFEDLEIRERHGYKFLYTASELKKRGATVGRRSVSEKHSLMTLTPNNSENLCRCAKMCR